MGSRRIEVVKQSATTQTKYDTMLYLINRINMLLWSFVKGSERERGSNFKTVKISFVQAILFNI